MKKSFAPHLHLIRIALAQIQQYQPTDEDSFLAHPMAQDAILMRWQKIGENLARMRHIDGELFAANAADSWTQLIEMRNVISHGYHVINPTQIWQIVTEELPAFAATIENLSDQP